MKTKSDNFLFESELKWENPSPGVKRQIMGYDGQLMIVKVLCEKDAIVPVHQHFHSQASYVVSGKFEIQIGEEKKILSPGDGCYTEPDLAHGVVCLEEGIVIDTFSPTRVDFL
ncbi:MAG: cupin domain-containing protein [Rikenellaceae bacterium]